MNLSKPKIFLVLGVIAAVMWFVVDDEPVETEPVKVTKRDTRTPLKPEREITQFGHQNKPYSRAPVYPPGYYNQYGQSPGLDNRWESQYPESRFRPLDQDRNRAESTKTDPRQFQPTTPNFSYGPGEQEYPQFRYNDGRTQSDSMSGRFRPWDEKRQSRRWQGNFHRMAYWPEQLAAPDRYSHLRFAYAD